MATISVDSLQKELENIDGAQDKAIVESVEILNQLVQDEGKDWKRGTLACKELADALRIESLRTPLGEANIIKTLAALLEKSKNLETSPQLQVDFRIQALRVLGNLCFDNESNRERVKGAGIISLVAEYFKSGEDSLIMIVCGFYLNSSMDYDPIKSEIAECGAAESLVKLIDPHNSDKEPVAMAIKVIDGLSTEETARKLIATTTTVEVYLRLIEYMYESDKYIDEFDDLEDWLYTLLQLIMDDDNLQNHIIDLGKLNFLLDFLEKSNIDIANKEDKEKLESIRKTLSKIAVYASSTDSKMEEIYSNEQILTRMLNMAKSEDLIVQQYAVYALGNLARSDKHCVELVEKRELSKILLKLYESTENAPLQYAILCCLKHLCLPVPNKSVIGDDNCISILAPNLKESKDMLKRNQFLTIVVIKLLCIGNYKNACRVIEEGVLSLVIAFLERVNNDAEKSEVAAATSETAAAISEATRVLTNVAKAVWVEKDNNELRNKVIELNVIQPIIELVCTSHFPILRNEGVMALTLIFSDSESNSILIKALPMIISDSPAIETTEKAQPENRSFLKVVADDICSEKENTPVEIKCNACVLLLKIIEVAKSEPLQYNVIDLIKKSIDVESLKPLLQNKILHPYVDSLLKALGQ